MRWNWICVWNILKIRQGVQEIWSGHKFYICDLLPPIMTLMQISKKLSLRWQCMWNILRIGSEVQKIFLVTKLILYVTFNLWLWPESRVSETVTLYIISILWKWMWTICRIRRYGAVANSVHMTSCYDLDLEAGCLEPLLCMLIQWSEHVAFKHWTRLFEDIRNKKLWKDTQMKRQIDNMKKNTTKIFKGDKCQLHNINCGPHGFLKVFHL